jgi:hypothetical protein
MENGPFYLYHLFFLSKPVRSGVSGNALLELPQLMSLLQALKETLSKPVQRFWNALEKRPIVDTIQSNPGEGCGDSTGTQIKCCAYQKG